MSRGTSLGCKLKLTGVFAAFSLIGCAQQPKYAWSPQEPASAHVIAINEKGFSIDPDHPGEFDDRISSKCARDQIQAMLTRASAWTTAHSTDGSRRLLIFVHGGLDDPLEKIEGLPPHVWKIMNSPAPSYPIFIVWNSGFASSYGEHLTRVRQGRYNSDQAWAAPFFLFADFGRAIARLPIVLGRMVAHDVNRVGSEFAAAFTGKSGKIITANEQLESTMLVTKDLVDTYGRSSGDSVMPVSLGDVDGNLGSLGSLALQSTTAITSLSTTWLLDSLGSAAWDNMFRRSMILFDGPVSDSIGTVQEKDSTKLAFPGQDNEGGLQILIEELAKRAPQPLDDTAPQRAVDGGMPWHITVIGHSMGSIVLNEFVSRSSSVDINEIVYMAAACTVRDAQSAVVPYLQSHTRTNFYDLCLHPVNDLREWHYAGFLPHGSLLTWIDDMFANPATPFDRTMGRWDNAVQTAFAVPDPIRSRYHLKGFAIYKDVKAAGKLDIPQMHGEFMQCKYWLPDFWQPLKPADAVRAFRPTLRQMSTSLDLSPDKLFRATTQPAE